MSKPTVFVFSGRGYFKYPGTEYRMFTVDEDYQGSRPFAGEWPKAERWLVAHGYRRLWGTPVRRDGCDVRVVWGKVEVFGEPNVTYTDTRAVRAMYDHWLEGQAA